MSVNFEKTPYRDVFIEKTALKDAADLPHYAKKELRFKQGSVSRKEFNPRFSTEKERRFGRKIGSIPIALRSGVAYATCQAARAVFQGIPSAFSDRGFSFKIHLFKAIRELQEGYGRLASLFNERYGAFHVQESLFHKQCYACIEERLRFMRQDRDLYSRLPSEFIEDVLRGRKYDPLEMQELSKAAERIYWERKQRRIGPLFLGVSGKKRAIVGNKDWVADTTTLYYLKNSSLARPSFRPFLAHRNQFNVKAFKEEMQEIILPSLPSTLPKKGDREAHLYGHALQVNCHRTAFIIDLQEKTVEYFNSYGNDRKAKKSLIALSEALSDKYGETFTYRHLTENICLQKDYYQCGVWTCKLIEERIEQGANFNPAVLHGFDIAAYRQEMYAGAFRYRFFEQVGRLRYRNYLKELAIEEGRVNFEKSERLYAQIDHLLELALAIEKDESAKDFSVAKEKFLLPLLVQWGQSRIEEVPNGLKSVFESLEKN